jgi:ABC-type multidrug transport system fused ATPase/permease subunit
LPDDPSKSPVFQPPPDRVSSALRSRRRLLAVCIAAASIAQLAEIPLALLIGRLIDHAPSASASPAPGPASGATVSSTVLAWFLAGLAALVGVRWLARWCQVAWSERLAQSVLADLRLRMFARLHRVRLAKLSRRDPGRVASRFAGDSASLRTWIATSLVESPTDALLIVVCLSVSAVIHPALALVAFLAILPCVPLLFLIDPRVRRDTREARAEQARFTGDVVSTLRNAAPLRRTGLSASVRRAAISRLRLVRDSIARRGRREALLKATVLAASSLACVGVAVAGIGLLHDGKISTGALVSATWIASLMVGPLNRLATAALMRGRSRVARERIAALFALPVERFESTSAPAQRAFARLRFREVVVPIDASTDSRPIEATLEGPGVFQIDGPIGACRHLALALLREARLQSGRIGLNGVRLSKHPRASLRGMIWLVDGEGHAATADPEAAFRAWRQAPILCPDHARTVVRMLPALRPARMSSAMRLQAGIAAGIARNCAVLVVELPRDLDAAARRVLEAWLAGNGGSRLIITYGASPPLDVGPQMATLVIRPANNPADEVLSAVPADS